MAVIAVRPGMMTSVQDGGRHGLQHLGVPVAGPMDWWSYQAANRLAGNEDGAAALEVTLLGPELEFTRSATVAVIGANFELTLSGTPVPMNQPFAAAAGDRLTFGARTTGARAYVAVGGGFGAPVVMGSRATHVKGALGGHEGRILRRGDTLPLAGAHTRAIAPRPVNVRVPHLPAPAPAVLRAIEGPEPAGDAFWDSTFVISPQSDRMGYRLDGPVLEGSGSQLSSGVAMGTVQVTPSGTCVLLMADRATSGGYPRAATVITADLPIAGQLAPGDTLQFRRATLTESRSALSAMRAGLPAVIA